MSVFVQRLVRLRAAYPVLLRLGCDNNNHSRLVLSVIPKRGRSTPSAAWIDSQKAQGFTTPAAVTANKNDDDDDVGPEKIPENTYAHTLFLNSLKYANTVMQPKTTYSHVTNSEALEILEKDWSSMTNVETVSAVKKLSYNICRNNEKIEPLQYTKAFDTLKVQNLTNDDLITIMQHLVPFSSHMKNCNFYNNLCGRIDRECMMRFSRLPTEKMLYLCDIMYQITSKHIHGVPSQFYSQYVWYSIRYLGNRPKKLKPEHLVQILFFLNIYRKPPINMYELEFHLEQCMDELSINELAIVALGFFKTSTKIRNKDFLSRIIQRTIAEIDMVDTVSIAGLIKLIR